MDYNISFQQFTEFGYSPDYSLEQDFHFEATYKTEFPDNSAVQNENSGLQTSDDQLGFDLSDREASFNVKNVRKRKPREAWKVGRPWLKFVDDVMFCTYCSEDGMSCSFTEGCKAGRLISVNKHEQSEIHRIAVARRETNTDFYNAIRKNLGRK